MEGAKEDTVQEATAVYERQWLLNSGGTEGGLVRKCLGVELTASLKDWMWG